MSRVTGIRVLFSVGQPEASGTRGGIPSNLLKRCVGLAASSLAGHWLVPMQAGKRQAGRRAGGQLFTNLTSPQATRTARRFTASRPIIALLTRES